MKISRARLIACGLGAGLGALLAAPVDAQVTMRVSVTPGGVPANGNSTLPSISADARYVAFSSYATNLVPGDTNGMEDVFVRDRLGGPTQRVSVDSAGVQGDSFSRAPSISADGRYVAFHSFASNLVAGDANGVADVFVRDLQEGTTVRASVGGGGAEGNGTSDSAAISADGRFVAFSSSASNLVPGDGNAVSDVFVRDLQTGATERVSVSTAGVEGNEASLELPSISADGRFVAFWSFATNLGSADTNATFDVFVRDRQNGTTKRVSVDSGGAQGDGASSSPAISADGRFVAFSSLAANLVAGDTNGFPDVFVRDLLLGSTERVSVDSGGAEGNDGSYFPSISADGGLVAFSSYATNLAPGSFTGALDLYLRDRAAGTTARASVDSSGAQANGDSAGAPISADGRFVAFWSDATNLVPGDTLGFRDVFVRDRSGGTSLASLCDPGIAGVTGCPCLNPPSGSGRGCDNSSATGGAILSGSGATSLSSDSFVFTTSAEGPTATSILLQGTGSPASGIVYGQGVRCVAGSLERLFTKSAAGGAITAPDFAAGDPSLSARSAAKGDVIGGGGTRWYLVFYRDPAVLGGCPASSTFNATQTARIVWSW